MTRREFTRNIMSGGALFAMGMKPASTVQAVTRRPNILLITADDMNWDTPGCCGGRTPGITPNTDRLASGGVTFELAHMTIAVCQPSRSVLMTGRYPHRNGAEGFDPISDDVPTLQEQLHRAGYLNGILGKVGHLKPNRRFMWDMQHDFRELGFGRDPKAYHDFARHFFTMARAAKKPFFLMANSHDPHRPFHGSLQEYDKKAFRENRDLIPEPSRVYGPDDVDVPGFVADLPDSRIELAQYYSSARRCDDTVGSVLSALDESGMRDDTVVMFLSDNGMSFPFSKTNCYLNSTRTPWIVRWPGTVMAGTRDGGHFISGIDFMPTILDITGQPMTPGMDGTSFRPLLHGERQSGRDVVFTQFHETSGRLRFPMRCIQDRRHGYIFNPWSDGSRVFESETKSGLTFDAMAREAEKDPETAERVDFFLHRRMEEFYHLENDPDALTDLMEDREHAGEIEAMRFRLEKWMENTGDPAIEAFRNRYDPDVVSDFMRRQQALADSHRGE